MIYDLFYNFILTMIGATAGATPQGLIFATYGAYVGVVLSIIGVCWVIKSIFRSIVRW